MIKIDLEKQESMATPDQIAEGPKKSSKSGAKESFLQEEIYQKHSFPKYDVFLLKGGVDSDEAYNGTSFRFSRQQYGRINDKLLPIIPVEERMEVISSLNDVRVLDFIADAYRGFKINLALLIQRKSISPNSKFANFAAVGSTKSLEDSYYDFSNLHYSFFLDFVNSSNYHKDIKDLNSFINVFTKFTDTRTPTTLFTKSSFACSKFCSPKISGLFIDLDTGDINDDKNKYDNYLTDPSFKCYYDVALDHGFVINRDKPWQIVADLESPRMKHYFFLRMQKYVNTGLIAENPLNCSSNVFEECEEELRGFNLYNFLFNNNKRQLKYYNVVNDTDLETLKTLVVNMYNSYVQYKPMYETTSVIRKNNNFIVEKKKIERKYAILKNVIESQENYLWIRLYTYLKAREANLEWMQPKFNFIVNKSNEINLSVDIAAAMRYVQSEINTVKISNIKQRNFQF